MKIRYTIPFKRKIFIDDHWPVPFQNGTLRIIDDEGHTKAVEITFENQPSNYSPDFSKNSDGVIAATLTHRDMRLHPTKVQLDNAISFLECMFDIDLVTDEILAEYEAETEKEVEEIVVSKIASEPNEPLLPLSFDFLTRALMAAQNSEGPSFESTLIRSARKATAKKAYIDSFRYSFLLIEATFGGGNFKTAGLKNSLKSSENFREIVTSVLMENFPIGEDQNSPTAVFIKSRPSIDEVIDHLVDFRGFYFHGNMKRKNAWRPDDQSQAESLAHLAASIALNLSMQATKALFSPEFERQHFDDAKRAGAIIVFQVHYNFREPDENFDRTLELRFSIPGTKPTSRSAFYIFQNFFSAFQSRHPLAELKSANCKMVETGQQIFDLKFYVD